MIGEEKVILDILTERKTAPVPLESGPKADIPISSQDFLTESNTIPQQKVRVIQGTGEEQERRQKSASKVMFG